jgi:prepilin-type N-terminal cleavage/methylation domain-containing protein
VDARRVPQRGEQGFTLIELLIVLVVLPLVVGAIAMVLITMLRNQQGVQGKVTDATAASTASAYYVRDLESAGSVTTAQTPASSPAQCHTSSLSGSINYLLGLRLQGTTTVVSYYELTPARGAPELVRASCTDNSGSLTELSHQILSDNISVANPPVAEVSCLSPTPTSIPTGVQCNPTTDWTFTYLVAPVTMNITQGCSTPSGSCAPYQYALTGDPVSGVPVPPINQPNGALTLLGPGSDIQFGTGFLTGSNSVCAVGPIVLASGYDQDGSSAAITGNSSDDVDTGTTASCSSSGSNAVDVYSCRSDNSNGNACPVTGSNTAVSGGVDVTPAPVDLSATVSDPLLTWAGLHTVGGVSGAGSCSSFSSPTITCTDGVYPNGLSFPSNKTVMFSPGDYQFGGTSSVTCNGFFSSLQTSLCIQSNDTVDFGTGHYTFENGLDVVGSNTSLCGGGPSTSACPSSPQQQGVFFYVKGGNTNLGNVNFGSNIQLAPLGNGDKFAGVLLWQDGSDSNPVLLASAASSLNTYGGTIYAPQAELSFYGFGNSITTGNIVASRISFPFGSGCNVTVQ